MNDDQDEGSKSEDPTDKKIEEALQKGNMPLSKEIVTFGGIAGIYISLHFIDEPKIVNFAISMHSLIANSSDQQAKDIADLTLGQWHVIESTAALCVPIILVMAVLNVAAAAVQNRPRFTLERIAPKLDRISLRSGLRRLFSQQGAIESVKILCKLLIIGVVVFTFVAWIINYSNDVISMESHDLWRYLFIANSRFLSVVLLVIAMIGLADLFLVRFHWKKNLRMTRKELKDELKESEGDPLFKSHRRSLALQRSRNRMMSAVPTATMIIANPTHYAIALRYVRDKDATPVVVAKGLDKLALRIREIGESNNVPVIENKSLARALYGVVSVDQQIPADFYQAVATIIVMLQRKR